MHEDVDSAIVESGEHEIPYWMHPIYEPTSREEILDRWGESGLPGWHPENCCGPYCDGQDGCNSNCGWSKHFGPPPDWEGGDLIPLRWIASLEGPCQTCPSEHFRNRQRMKITKRRIVDGEEVVTTVCQHKHETIFTHKPYWWEVTTSSIVTPLDK